MSESADYVNTSLLCLAAYQHFLFLLLNLLELRNVCQWLKSFCGQYNVNFGANALK